MNSTTPPSSPPNTLPRVLGPWIAMAIVVGTVIGSGVFKKGQNVAERVPEFGLAISVWVLGGLLALLGALVLAEVAVLFPRAGGNYQFLKEGYGRLFGFLWGWVEFWIIRSASIAALATMFTESLHDIVKQVFGTPTPTGYEDVIGFWPRHLLTVGVIGALALVNIRGTRVGGGLQFVLTLIKVGSLVAIAVLPFVVVAVVGIPEHPPRLEHLAPMWPADWSAVDWGKYGAALVGVLWAYHGWMNIGPVAEEVRQPHRNIPLALLGGVFLLIALYLAANVAYYLVMPREVIAGLKNTTVATEFCFRLLGTVGITIASLIVMCSVFGALNGNILVAPRLLFAMGQDGLAPTGLMRLHPRYQTPALATAIFAGWSCLLVLGFGALLAADVPLFETGQIDADGRAIKKSPFDAVTDFAMFGAVAFETLAVATIFIFRYRLPNAVRPYRCVGYPVVPALYVCIMVAVLVNMFAGEQRSEAVIGLGFILIGAVVYAVIFGRRPKG